MKTSSIHIRVSNVVVSFRFSDQVKDVTNKETLLKSQLRRQSLNVAKLSSVSTCHTLLLIYTLSKAIYMKCI